MVRDSDEGGKFIFNKGELHEEIELYIAEGTQSFANVEE